MTLRTQLTDLVFSSALYDLCLGRKVPRDILGTPPDPWPGNGALAESLIVSPFTFTETATPAAGGPWFTTEASAAARTKLHGFGWLSDLRGLGSDAARTRARGLVRDWLIVHGRWRKESWRADVLGLRLASWFTNFGFLTAGADDAFRQALLASLPRQARHLRRAIARAEPGIGMLHALRGLLYAGVCLPEMDDVLGDALNLLDREITRQILPDGGHIQRCPTIQVEALRLLVDIRGTLAAAYREIPASLQPAIDRMAPMARSLRHGDGRMALFNGGNEEEDKDLSTLLAQAGARGKAISSAPHSGFNRLAAGRTLVIVDAGVPPPPGLDRRAHAGTLSFEMSVGRDRLVVNCGDYRGDDPDWNRALRATAAHSTLAVNDVNSSDVIPDGGLGRRPRIVDCQRREADGNLWLETSHDGYSEILGLVHHRHFYLSHDGADFRGMDSLVGTGKPVADGATFTIRFHLHPQVQSSLVRDGTQVLLKMPTGTGWRFMAAGGTLAQEDSVYLGAGDGVRRCRQIVVTGKVESTETMVKWAFHREAK